MLLITLEDYQAFAENLEHCEPLEKKEIVRYLCRTDLFFLLWFACGRNDLARPWLIERCHEVQTEPDGFLDLWAREHYKSTIITFGKTIQDILASHGDDPLPQWQGIEATFGIFSFNRPIAKAFLQQIKRELENNQLLREAFPDVLWENPGRDAPKWSEELGIIVKRKSNPKEATIEAWGVVDGQPTSKHFDVLIYDDIVTRENVTTPEMIKKTTQAWELSLALGREGGKRRHIGTRYHFNDTYREMIKRGAVKARIYAITKDGTPNGEPVLMQPETVIAKRRDMGSYTFSCQMLQNPVGDETQNFKKEWLMFHKGSNGETMNRYILVDPASEKKKTSDYTAMEVVGLGADNNYYTLDVIRDRLNLTQRAEALFYLHKKWKPLGVGYEKYGLQADIEHIKYLQEQMNYRFIITELGGQIAKNDRIKQLIPIFEANRWYLPESRFYTDYEGKTVDLVDIFINEEYTTFPVPVHDDMFDVKARILDPDLNATWPMIDDDEKYDRYSRRNRRKHSAWAA